MFINWLLVYSTPVWGLLHSKHRRWHTFLVSRSTSVLAAVGHLDNGPIEMYVLCISLRKSCVKIYYLNNNYLLGHVETVVDSDLVCTWCEPSIDWCYCQLPINLEGVLQCPLVANCRWSSVPVCIIVNGYQNFIHFGFLCFWSVGCSHDGCTILLANPTQVRHWLHYCDVGGHLGTKSGILRSPQACLVASLYSTHTACPHSLYRSVTHLFCCASREMLKVIPLVPWYPPCLSTSVRALHLVFLCTPCGQASCYITGLDVYESIHDQR